MSKQQILFSTIKKTPNLKNSHHFYRGESCTLGYLNSQKNNRGLASSHFSQTAQTNQNLPTFLHSQLPVDAFIECNNAHFKGNKNDKNVGFSQLNDKLQLNLSQSLLNSQNLLAHTLCQLEGHFRLAAYNQKTNVFMIAVSPFNPETLFYAQIPEYPNTFVISTSIKPLISLVKPHVDPSSIALWLSGRPNPNMSLYNNIHQVAQANYLLIDKDGGIYSKQYWDISSQTKHDLDDVSKIFTGDNSNRSTNLLTRSQEQLRHLLNRSVQHQFIGYEQTKPMFCQLSGGMDSTSVAATAFNSIERADLKLHTISHTYANTQSCDEIDNITAMTSTFNFAQNHFIELDKYTQMSFADLYPTHAQSPGMVLSPKYYEEASLLQQFGANILLTGNGGDEMFWGHSLAYYDRLKRGDVRVIKEVANSAKKLGLPVIKTLRSVFATPFLKYDLKPFVRLADRISQLNSHDYLPPWLTAKSKQLIKQAPSLNNPFSSVDYELAKCARYEGIFNTSTFNSMRSYQAVFDEVNQRDGTNLQVRHPLFTKEIAEFSFSVDQQFHISGHYPKLLLRQSMDGLLPKQVCWDQQKTVFDQHFAKLVKENATSLRILLQHEALQDLGLVDNAKLLDAFNSIVSSQKPSLNVDLLYAILVQSWYQTHVEQ